MNALPDNADNWDELLENIDGGLVIPVVGQGLYYIDHAEHEEGELLYDFLAKKLAEAEKFTLPEEENHKFSRAAFLFLQSKGWGLKAKKQLRLFLIDALNNVQLSKNNPLLKLARITPFNLFINTTYDVFLTSVLQSTRRHKCNFINYTLNDAKLTLLNDELFNAIEENNCTLVYNIYGNLKERFNSAFTERDILETIVSFQGHMEKYFTNPLFRKLKNCSVLFIGCGYDDWLFRFFIRTVSNNPFNSTNFSGNDTKLKFVGEAINNGSTTYRNLSEFLINHSSKVIYSPDSKSFVETLFNKFSHKFPDKILPVSDFPETAFISFNGDNREEAFKLADRLKADGINVWVDRRIEPGNIIDAIIKNTIIRCAVFIPIISHEAQTQWREENGERKEKYHYKEWNWLKDFNDTDGNVPKIVIPVIIDDTSWMHKDFTNFYHINLFGGKNREYNKLKKRLLELQPQVERLTP